MLTTGALGSTFGAVGGAAGAMGFCAGDPAAGSGARTTRRQAFSGLR